MTTISKGLMIKTSLIMLVISGILGLYMVNLSGSYLIDIKSQKRMLFQYQSAISEGKSPACGCMKRLDENRGISFPASNVKVSATSSIDSHNVKRHLVIQSGSLWSNYLPSLSFELEVYSALDFDRFSVVDENTVLNFISDKEPLFTQSEVYQLTLDNISDFVVIPDKIFPYLGYIPPELENLELNFLGNNNHVQLKHETSDIEVLSNIPDIGSPYIHPRIEAIGSSIAILVNDLDALKDRTGLNISSKVERIIKYKNQSRRDTDSPIILVVRPQFSILIHYVSTTGIRDTNGSILGWNPKLDLVTFVDKPTKDLVSINLVRYSRAKSNIVLDVDLLNNNKHYSKMLALSGENVEREYRKHISMGGFSTVYRYPDLNRQPSISIWGKVKKINFFDSAGSITSNFHEQTFVSNRDEGLSVLSVSKLSGYKSIEIAADGSSNTTFDLAQVEVNGKPLGRVSHALVDFYALIALLVILIGLGGSISVFVKKAEKFK